MNTKLDHWKKRVAVLEAGLIEIAHMQLAETGGSSASYADLVARIKKRAGSAMSDSAAIAE